MSHLSLQVVNDNYSRWGDQQLVDHLFTCFCTNGRVKRLCKQLPGRFGNTQRASKEKQRLTKNLSQDQTLCTLFWTLRCRDEGMWHNAHMPTSGSTLLNSAVEPLTQMMNLCSRFMTTFVQRNDPFKLP